jgi:CDK inhibitor PHO81
VNHAGIELQVSQLTYEQFSNLRSQYGRESNPMHVTTSDSIAEIHQILASSFISLRDALASLPPGMNVNLQVLYPTVTDEQALYLGRMININTFADAILDVVFEYARSSRDNAPNLMRSIVFSSYNADICTALNWKQPNCKFQNTNLTTQSCH